MKLLIVLLSATFCFVNAVPLGQAPKAKCGSPAVKPDTSTNIIGGKTAIPYSWPWSAVFCEKQRPGECNLQCGGTLISNQWIMTAGHCFDPNTNPAGYSFKLGVFNQTHNDEEGEQVLDISEFHIHPKYNGGGGQVPPTFDISLAKLKTPVEFTDHISPVCLPEKDKDLPAAGTPLFLTGWGRTQNSVFVGASNTLQQVSVPVVPSDKCKRFLWDQEFDTIFCVGFDEGGKGSCSGDSGGPAVYQDPANNGQWTQIGITSFGKGSMFQPCSGEYSGYSKVSKYIDFIHEYVKDLYHATRLDNWMFRDAKY